jgi:hypothetical protein
MESKDDMSTVKESLLVKEFDPKSLASKKILELKLVNVEINQESDVGKQGKDNYAVDFIFENIFQREEYTPDMEKHFDTLYEIILSETGIYLEDIEIIDETELYAWGTIYKEDDKYYTCKPDNTE